MDTRRVFLHRLRAAATALAIACAMCVAAGPAQAQSGAQIGKLECVMTESRNLVVRSTMDFDCEFIPVSGEIETYTARMTRTGLDLSVRRHFVIVWAVLAPTEVARQPGSLRGTYVGGTADVSLGAGIGASVLVGGGANSFTLQPLSIAGVVGVGASLGVSRLVLE
jgi:hypothetical protein